MYRFLNKALSVFIAVIYGLAIFFTVEVLLFKKDLNSGGASLVIESGETVKIIRIIDGDEVQAQCNDQRFVVRLLGIKSYDPSVNDPNLQNFARLALYFLEETLLNQEVLVYYDNYKFDSKGRLLAYIEYNNKDVGLEMVSMGYSLVYDRFEFSRMEGYKAVEAETITEREGLWAVPKLRVRSMELKKIWAKKKRG